MTLHLTVNKAGVVSLWDSEKGACGMCWEEEHYAPLVLTPEQEAYLTLIAQGRITNAEDSHDREDFQLHD